MFFTGGLFNLFKFQSYNIVTLLLSQDNSISEVRLIIKPTKSIISSRNYVLSDMVMINQLKLMFTKKNVDSDLEMAHTSEHGFSNLTLALRLDLV